MVSVSDTGYTQVTAGFGGRLHYRIMHHHGTTTFSGVLGRSGLPDQSWAHHAARAARDVVLWATDATGTVLHAAN